MTSRDSAEETTEALREESQTDNHPPIMTAATARSVAARHIMRIILKLLMVSESAWRNALRSKIVHLHFFLHQKSHKLIYHTNWSNVDDSHRNENLLSKNVGS